MVELPYLIGANSGREIVFCLFALAFTPVLAVGALVGPERWGSVAMLLVCLAGDVTIVKVIDDRIERRAAARARWADPAFLDQARRYHLRTMTRDATTYDAMTNDGERMKLRLAGSNRVLGDPRDTIGILRGEVHDREVAITEVVRRHGPLEWTVLGITWLRRPHPKIELTPRLWTPRRRQDEPSEFERTFRVRGEGAPEVGLKLQSWLVANAPGMAFEVQDDILVCRMNGEAVLTTDEIGRYLSALLGFAARLEGRTPPPGA